MKRVLAASRLPLSVAVLAVPAAVAVARLLLATRRPFDFFGDEAILESAVRHVGEQLVGPYSRFGFHQPGPAYFYLQAPFYRMTGASTAALFLGAYCINLGAALGTVLVVRRFLGEPSARWAAAVVGALLLGLTPGLVADPWNPYVLALPLLLALALAAAGVRSPAAAGAAIVVASYVVQTHLAAAATLAAAFITAAIVALAHHRRSPREAPSPPSSAGRWAAPAAAAVVCALMWAPPLIEQFTRSPGNLTTLTRFFRASHPELDRGIDHGVSHTARRVAAELTVLPFGHDREEEPAGTARILLAIFGTAAGIGVAVAGWRRREPVLTGLGAMSVVGPLVAVWSGTRIVGEVFPYLLLWTSSLLVPGAIGAGALLLPDRRWGRALAGAAAVIVGLCLTVAMTRDPLLRPTRNDVAAAVQLAEPWLTSRGARHVRIGIADHDRWPLATGVAVGLEKEGFTITVDQEWTSLFGEHFRPTDHEKVTVWLADADSRPPAATASPTPLGLAGDASVWASDTVLETP